LTSRDAAVDLGGAEDVMRYAYRKLDLNMAPPRALDLDLLNAAGKEGWRLMLVTSNCIA